MSVFDTTSDTYYPTLSAAITGSSANDVIRIAAGAYVENFPNITHSLTIDAVGGLAYLSTPLPQPVNGRAILNVPGDGNVSLSISGLVLSGAVDSVNNGAGILFESGNAALTVSNSWIYGNQDGILTGGADAASIHGMTVTIDHSEIDGNGVAPTNPMYGGDHNLYIGAVSQFTIANSYIHDALGGHEIKSRALASTIIDNRISDGPTAATSYSIDLSDGGTAVVSGNIIEKGPAAQNRYAVHFAGEAGVTYAGSSLLLSGNTIINDRSAATALLNQSKDATGHTIAATVIDNTLYKFPTNDLNQDAFGPPFDQVSNNTFIYGADPTLDTSHPFQVPASPVPAPSATSVFPLALLVAAVLRRWHGPRRRKQTRRVMAGRV